jgi:hypothetical protein
VRAAALIGLIQAFDGHDVTAAAGNGTLRGRPERSRGPIDTLLDLPDTMESVGNDIWATAKLKSANAELKSEIRDGRQSWIPMNLAGGGS